MDRNYRSKFLLRKTELLKELCKDHEGEPQEELPGESRTL